MKRVIFICTENSNRSQMAEAFARIHGRGVVEAWSAGSEPSGTVNPKAVAAMAEKGYDLSGHRSKSTHDLPPGPWDFVITMGCGDACPWLDGVHREDWELPNPKGMSPAELYRIRDEIERRVRSLVEGVSGGAAEEVT